MRLRKGTLVTLLALKYFGLIPWSYDKVRCKIVCTRSDILTCFAAFVVINGFSAFSMLFVLMRQEEQIFGSEHDTSFIYQLSLTAVTWICQSGIMVYCWLERGTSLKILQTITRWDAKYVHVENTFWKDCLFRWLLVWFIGCSLSSSNVIITLPLLGCTPHRVDVLSSLFFAVEAFIGGFLAINYASLVAVLNDIFHAFNFGIMKASELKTCYYRIELKRLLAKRATLLELCRSDVNRFYGVCILFILWHSVMVMISLPLAVTRMLSISDNFSTRFALIYASVLWFVIFLVGTACIFCGDCIDEQANKTAKILSRITRKGTGIEKMIDKFLMKNMHQEPILTAYGFFPLNKRTLFKIFAAIFTYMVILVQFKDMESTNKKLASEAGKPMTTTAAAGLTVS